MLLASLPMSFKALVQMLLVGRSTLNLDEVAATLRENERMIRTENVDDEHNAIAMMETERGRNHSRKHNGPRGRSKSQSCPQRDMNHNRIHNEI